MPARPTRQVPPERRPGQRGYPVNVRGLQKTDGPGVQQVPGTMEDERFADCTEMRGWWGGRAHLGQEEL